MIKMRILFEVPKLGPYASGWPQILDVSMLDNAPQPI